METSLIWSSPAIHKQSEVELEFMDGLRSQS